MNSIIPQQTLIPGIDLDELEIDEVKSILTKKEIDEGWILAHIIKIYPDKGYAVCIPETEIYGRDETVTFTLSFWKVKEECPEESMVVKLLPFLTGNGYRSQKVNLVRRASKKGAQQ